MSTRTPTVLERILAETRDELERRKRHAPMAQLVDQRPVDESPVERTGRGRFHRALLDEGIAVIAEFKRRSPSAGSLSDAPDLLATVEAYERGGASAVSVLTEGPNFGGALADLRGARDACALPLLRKDFIVDAYQLQEANAAGADAVLLIVAALEREQLAALYDAASAIGLDVLVEVHDHRELHTALEVGARIVGINNRDLRDFSVDVQRTERLLEHVPDGVTVVSESGISSPAQLQRLQERGVHAVLVGETLMRSSDPAAALSELRSFKGADSPL